MKRKISVRKHRRTSPLGKRFTVRLHSRTINSRKNPASFHAHDRGGKDKKPDTTPAGIIRSKLRRGVTAKPQERDKRTEYYSERYLRNLSKKYPHLVGFSVEGGEIRTKQKQRKDTGEFYEQKETDVKIIPIFLYGKEDLEYPNQRESLQRELEGLVTDLNNEIDDEFFANRSKLNPANRYQFKSGQTLNNLYPIYTIDADGKNSKLYKFEYILAVIDQSGKIVPHSEGVAYFVPEIEGTKEVAGMKRDIYLRQVTGPDGKLWRKVKYNQHLINYSITLREYKQALNELNDGPTNNPDKSKLRRARFLENQLGQHQRLITKIYSAKGKDIVAIPNYKFNKFTKKQDYLLQDDQKPKRQLRGFLDPNDSKKSIDAFTDPASFAVLDMKTRKPIDPKKIEKDAITANKKLPKELMSVRGSTGFYLDPYHYYNIKGENVERLEEINKNFPIGYYHYKDGKSLSRKIIWSDASKIDSFQKINDPDETLINRQREWNHLVKKTVQSYVARNKTYTRNVPGKSGSLKQATIPTDIEKVKIFKKEPIAWSVSEKRLAEEIVGTQFPPMPGTKPLFVTSRYREKPVRKVLKKDSNEQQSTRSGKDEKKKD